MESDRTPSTTPFRLVSFDENNDVNAFMLIIRDLNKKSSNLRSFVHDFIAKSLFFQNSTLILSMLLLQDFAQENARIFI